MDPTNKRAPERILNAFTDYCPFSAPEPSASLYFSFSWNAMMSYTHTAVVMSLVLSTYASEVPKELNVGTRILQDSLLQWEKMLCYACGCH